MCIILWRLCVSLWFYEMRAWIEQVTSMTWFTSCIIYVNIMSAYVLRLSFPVQLCVMQLTVLPRHFCLSVHLSVRHVYCDKMKETRAHILIPHERSFILVVWQEEWLGATPSDWSFGPNWSSWSEITNVLSIFARSTSAIKLSWKSSINTNRKSTTSFPISLRWTSYIVPKPQRGSLSPNGAQKCKESEI